MNARAAAVAWLAVLVVGCADAKVAIDDAWIRGARPGSTVAAGYCSITNTTAVSVTIVEFVGPGQVEMHQTETVDGVSRMRPLESLIVPPGQTVTLAPGGKHLMLHGFDPSVDEPTFKAVLDDGSSLPVTFEVRSWPTP